MNQGNGQNQGGRLFWLLLCLWLAGSVVLLLRGGRT